MSKPFLTIGIASYNYAQYLDKALEQIKRQNFRDFEILYSDDGSSDDSIAKIKQYIANEKELNIRLIEGEHEGLLANKNRLVDNAQGQYLMICDADDYMSDNCLEILCNAAREGDWDCVIAGFCEISDEGKVYKYHIPNENSTKWIYTWHHAQIYKLDIVRQHNIRFERIPDDVFYLQSIHCFCEKVKFISENVYYWCRHNNSTSASYDKNSDWHPLNLWNQISTFIYGLSEKQPPEEKLNIQYYLYKWYYFNIIDLWKEDAAERKEDVIKMRQQMKKILPSYDKLGRVKDIFRTADTLFARTAVFGCWVLERCHMTSIMIFARKLQNQMRK